MSVPTSVLEGLDRRIGPRCPRHRRRRLRRPATSSTRCSRSVARCAASTSSPLAARRSRRAGRRHPRPRRSCARRAKASTPSSTPRPCSRSSAWPGARVRERVFSINVGGTDAVIDACRAAGVKRLVYTSSANVAIDRELIEADESVGYAQSLRRPLRRVEGARRAGGAARRTKGRTSHRRRSPGRHLGPGRRRIHDRHLPRSARRRPLRRHHRRRPGGGRQHPRLQRRARLLLAAARLDGDPETVGGQAYFVTDDERINGVEWFRPIVEGLG